MCQGPSYQLGPAIIVSSSKLTFVRSHGHHPKLQAIDAANADDTVKLPLTAVKLLGFADLKDIDKNMIEHLKSVNL